MLKDDDISLSLPKKLHFNTDLFLYILDEFRDYNKLMIFVPELLTTATNLLCTSFAPIFALLILTGVFRTRRHLRWFISDRDFAMISIRTYVMNGVPASTTEGMFAIAVTPVFSIVRLAPITFRYTQSRLI